MSMKTLNAIQRIGYENLAPSQALGVKFLISEMKRTPLPDAIIKLSSINLLLSNEKRTPQTEEKLRSIYLDQKLQKCVLKFELSNGSGIIFNRQAALLLIHFARYYANDNVTSLNTEFINFNLGLFFLIINDFLSFVDDLNFVDHDQTMVAPHITRQYLFHHSTQERYSIPQSWLVFEGLKGQVKAHNFVDISAEIEKTRGYDIEEYFSILMILYSYCSRQTFPVSGHHFSVIDPKNIFSKASPAAKKKYLRILDSLSVEAYPSKPHPSLSKPYKWRKEIYEQFELRLKPLIKINNSYICSDIEFLKSAFWEGPYHIILTDHPQTDLARRMMNFLGDTTELFVRHIGKDAFRERFIDITNGANNPLGDGVIKINDDWIVLVESKAARPGIDMVSGDKPITQLKDFKKLIKDGLSQMSDRIQEYRNHDNFNGRITPFLITAGHIPQHKLIWDLVKEELKTLFLFNDQSTDFPFVMDLEVWNVICSSEKAGIPINDIISARYRDWSTMTSSPNYFMFEIIFNAQSQEEPPHPELLSLFEDRMQGLTIELFQTPLRNRKSKEGLWRPLFGIS